MLGSGRGKAFIHSLLFVDMQDHEVKLPGCGADMFAGCSAQIFVGSEVEPEPNGAAAGVYPAG